MINVWPAWDRIASKNWLSIERHEKEVKFIKWKYFNPKNNNKKIERNEVVHKNIIILNLYATAGGA